MPGAEIRYVGGLGGYVSGVLLRCVSAHYTGHVQGYLKFNETG